MTTKNNNPPRLSDEDLEKLTNDVLSNQIESHLQTVLQSASKSDLIEVADCKTCVTCMTCRTCATCATCQTCITSSRFE